MKKRILEKGILYLCIHKRIYDLANNKVRKGILPLKDFYMVLGRHYLVPKNLRAGVMREMENKKMVKLLGATRNSNIRVKPLFCDPIVNAHKFYVQLGLF